MTIGSELELVQNTVDDLRDAIASQNITVRDTDSWVDLEWKINNIKPTSDEDYPTQYILEEVLNGTIETLYDETLAYIRPSCFRFCTKLREAQFTKITKICRLAFRSCYNFRFLALPGDFVRLDNINAFLYTQIPHGAIYVNDDLLDTYKEAANWSAFADVIKPISEYYPEYLYVSSESDIEDNTDENVDDQSGDNEQDSGDNSGGTVGTNTDENTGADEE